MNAKVVYVFTDKVKTNIIPNDEGFFIEYINLKSLLSFISSDSNLCFENTKFNIMMARFFSDVGRIEKIIIDAYNPDVSRNICLFENLLNFVLTIPSNVRVELIEKVNTGTSILDKYKESILSLVNSLSIFIDSDVRTTRFLMNNFKKDSLKVNVFGGHNIDHTFKTYKKFGNDLFKINNFIFDTSFASLSSIPLKFKAEDVEIKNKPQAEDCLRNDLNKTTFLSLRDSLDNDSVFVFGLLEERFDIIKQNASLVTKSWNFISTKFSKSMKDAECIKFNSDEKLKLVLLNIDKLVMLVKSIGISERFLFDSSKMCTHYFNGDEFIEFDNLKYNIKEYNEFVYLIEGYIKDKYPEIKIIASPYYLNFTNHNHQWGVFPYHYNDYYYLSRAKNIVNNIFC